MTRPRTGLTSEVEGELQLDLLWMLHVLLFKVNIQINRNPHFCSGTKKGVSHKRLQKGEVLSTEMQRREKGGGGVEEVEHAFMQSSALESVGSCWRTVQTAPGTRCRICLSSKTLFISGRDHRHCGNCGHFPLWRLTARHADLCEGGVGRTSLKCVLLVSREDRQLCS